MQIKKFSITLLLLSAVLVSCGEMSQQSSSDATETEGTKSTGTGVKPIHLTGAEFRSKVMDFQNSTQWKYLGDKPAVVDFYATWCGPCKTIAPYLEELADEYGNDIYIYKIDVDKEGALSNAFNIRSIPTLLFIPMNGEPQRVQGAMSKQDLKSRINQILK